MQDLNEIPDDVPNEYLSGPALALRSDNPESVIEELSKGEVVSLIRHIFDVPNEFVGETTTNLSLDELRHIGTKAVENAGAE